MENENLAMAEVFVYTLRLHICITTWDRSEERNITICYLFFFNECAGVVAFNIV